MRTVLGLLALLILSSAAAARGAGKLQDGDILFQFIPCGPLCDAIAATTPCAAEHPFNHCGIVLQEGDSVLVLEAIGKDVHTTPLAQFLRRDTSHAVYVGRLKRSGGSEIRANLQRAKALRGRPYDNSYLPGDTALYCSELIYESYYRDGKRVFQTEPMSFKSADGTTDPGWTAYYRDMGIAIPEGLPGTNPCGLSRDPKLQLLRVLKSDL